MNQVNLITPREIMTNWDMKLHTIAHVSSLATSKGVLAASGTRMHSDRLADDETILNQLPDLLTWKLKVEFS